MGDESSQVSRPLSEDVQVAMKKKQEAIRALDGENKEITDGSYDESLAVKCINGTFVGKKSEGVITYRGIPFGGDQPVGEYRWKAPVEYRPDGRHAYDYMYYYNNIKDNAAKRVTAYLNNRT